MLSSKSMPCLVRNENNLDLFCCIWSTLLKLSTYFSYRCCWIYQFASVPKTYQSNLNPYQRQKEGDHNGYNFQEWVCHIDMHLCKDKAFHGLQIIIFLGSCTWSHRRELLASSHLLHALNILQNPSAKNSSWISILHILSIRNPTWSSIFSWSGTLLEQEQCMNMIIS